MQGHPEGAVEAHLRCACLGGWPEGQAAGLTGVCRPVGRPPGARLAAPSSSLPALQMPGFPWGLSPQAAALVSVAAAQGSPLDHLGLRAEGLAFLGFAGPLTTGEAVLSWLPPPGNWTDGRLTNPSLSVVILSWSSGLRGSFRFGSWGACDGLASREPRRMQDLSALPLPHCGSLASFR